MVYDVIREADHCILSPVTYIWSASSKTISIRPVYYSLCYCFCCLPLLVLFDQFWDHNFV